MPVNKENVDGSIELTITCEGLVISYERVSFASGECLENLPEPSDRYRWVQRVFLYARLIIDEVANWYSKASQTLFEIAVTKVFDSVMRSSCSSHNSETSKVFLLPKNSRVRLIPPSYEIGWSILLLTVLNPSEVCPKDISWALPSSSLVLCFYLGVAYLHTLSLTLSLACQEVRIIVWQKAACRKLVRWKRRRKR